MVDDRLNTSSHCQDSRWGKPSIRLPILNCPFIQPTVQTGKILSAPTLYSVLPNGANVFFLSVVFTLPPPSHHGSVWLLPVIYLFLTITVSRVRACLSIWLERFRGSQEDDERLALSIFFLYGPSSSCTVQYIILSNTPLPPTHRDCMQHEY
jgi:hypothetical protein